MFAVIRINGFGSTVGGRLAHPGSQRPTRRQIDTSCRDSTEGRRLMTRTASELAQFLGCTMEGEGSTPVSGVAAPASARATDLIYVDSPKHLERAAASAAGCAVIPAGLTLAGKTLLRASNPKHAFACAAEWLMPPAPIALGVHPTAVISPTAQLAAGVAVGPYAVIEDGVKIDTGTEVGAFCFLGRASTIGEQCR